MAEFIAESPRLLRLDLRENEIKTGGLMALSLALKVNTSLLRLDLDREPKKETVSMGRKRGGLKGECSPKQMRTLILQWLTGVFVSMYFSYYQEGMGQ